MENKPKIRVKGFEKNWGIKSLSSIATMHARIGWQNLRTSEYLNSGRYYLVTGTDFHDGRIDWDTCFYVAKERYVQDTKIQINNGNILITKDGTLGKVALVRELNKPATLNAGIFNVKVNVKEMNEEFAFQYLKAPYLMNYVKDRATGGTIKHLNQNILVDFPMVVPEIEEQVTIGNILKSIDGNINAQQKKYEKLLELKKACIEKIFPINKEVFPKIRFENFEIDWNEYKLGDFGQVLMNKRIYKEQTNLKEEIPFYKIGTFGSEADSFISKKLFLEFKKKYPYPKKGDILISASGSIGRTIKYNGEDAYFQDSNIVWLEHNNNIDNNFLKHLYSIIKWYGIEGSTIKRLYNSNILNTEVICPKLDEQVKIATLLDSFDNLISIQKDEIERLQNIKKALLEKMFI